MASSEKNYTQIVKEKGKKKKKKRRIKKAGNPRVPSGGSDVPSEEQNPQFYCHKKANSMVDGEG